MTDSGDDEFDFSHLLEVTRHRGVEDAAVREFADPGAQDPPTSPSASPAADASAPIPQPTSAGPARFCGRCGTPHDPEDRFCGGCGAAVAEVPAPVSRPAAAASAAATPPVAPAPGGTPAPSTATAMPPVDPSTTRTFRENPTTGIPIPDPVPAPPPAATSPAATSPSLITSTPPDAPAAPEVPTGEGGFESDQATCGLISEVPGISAPVATPGPTSEEVSVLPHPEPVPPSPPALASEPARRIPVENPTPPDPVATPADGVEEDDEDTATVSIAALRATRAAEAVARITGTTVQAVHCPNGHPNPAHRETCRVCDTAITDHTVSVIARPLLGALHFDDGHREALDVSLVIGRKPRADQTTGSEPARAVKLDDPDKLLSRVHAEIRLSDWQVQVIDRESMNHTFVQLPGQTMFQLRPGEPFPLPPGTRIVFGEVTSCRYVVDDPDDGEAR